MRRTFGGNQNRAKRSAPLFGGRSRVLGSTFAALCALWPAAATAAEDRSSKIIAEQLFEEAHALLERGEVATACEKLRESERLDPAGGTVLLLGVCYENDGKFASAWSALRSARAMAVRDGREDRRRIADAHLEALEPKVAHVTVNVPLEARLPGLVIRFDGVELADAARDVPLPVDPGPHELRVSAPAHAEQVATVMVPEVSRIEVAPLAEEQTPAPEAKSLARPILLASTGAGALVAAGVTFYYGIGAIVAEERKPLSCGASETSCISQSRTLESQANERRDGGDRERGSGRRIGDRVRHPVAAPAKGEEVRRVQRGLDAVSVCDRRSGDWRRILRARSRLLARRLALALPAVAFASVTACGLIIGDDPTVIIPAPDASAEAGSHDAAPLDSEAGGADGASADAAAPDASITSVAAIEMSANQYHTCVVRADGLLSCWGANNRNPLGNKDAFWSPTPQLARTADGGALADIVHVALGLEHACVQTGDAGLECWGSQDLAATGVYYLGTNAPPPGNTIPGAYQRIASKGAFNNGVDPWGDFSCAIDGSGQVECWGSNSHAALGQPMDSDAAGPDCAPGWFWCSGNPLVIPGISNAKRIALDDGGGCAALGDGTVACWGVNLDDEVNSSGADQPNARPILLADGTPLGGITDLAGGHTTICAIQGTGNMYCWGRGDEDEFGVPGATGDLAAPVEFAQGTLPNISEVAIGQGHVCVTAGPNLAVSCNGVNSAYEMGNGTLVGSGGIGTCDECVPTPTPVLRADGSHSQLTGVVQLAAGWDSTCARTSDGAVYCWGHNYLGATGHTPGTLGDVPCAVDYCTPYATRVDGI